MGITDTPWITAKLDKPGFPRYCCTMDPKYLDDLARTLMDSLPKGLQSMQADAKKNLQSALQSSLSRMNLVTREEFDIQTGVLARSREKLEQLERQLRDLEQRLADKKD